jgi:thiol-disulfide isomerase/thioredoxin
MKKIYLLLFSFIFSGFLGFAQKGFHIKINFKGCKDSTVYLARYFFDQLPVVDSCKNIKNGRIEFKGNVPLERGLYFLANQAKTSFYFQFIVDDVQNFSMSLDAADLMQSLKCTDEKLNEQFFSYVTFMTQKNMEVNKVLEQTKGKSKADSIKIVTEKQKAMNEAVAKFDADFMIKNKGNFVADIMNLKSEKYPKETPLAKNGRPDSIYQYYYYKNHFFDGINFKDNRILYTPFFAEKIKRYFDQIIQQHPDSVIKELDRVLKQCTPGSTVYNTLIGHFTYKYETNKSMSFDIMGNCNTFEKVFVHLAANYIVDGQTNGYYSDETVSKIKERIKILKNLLPGAKVADFVAIDTTDGKKVLTLGFDTAKTSASATYLYNKHADKLQTMFKHLYDVKAKYTLLVFWAADCGHCQTEIPKLNEELKELKGKVDFKVFAVQTKEELFVTWKKFVNEKNLNDFINVFDPIHINNLKETFDIQGTPVIYLLDKDKRIKGKKIASDQAVSIIKKLEEIENNLKSNNTNK